MIVTVSGPAGSGKTTLARLISERLGYVLITTGGIFREMASAKGLTVLQLNLLAEMDDGIDRELDRSVVEKAKLSGNCIVEGRLSCHMLVREGIKPFSVYLGAPAGVRTTRIALRDGRDAASAARETSAREESERRRYMRFYGIDTEDLTCYTMILDSAASPPEELADAVMKRLAGGTGNA